jgi:hypothetical protein
MKIKDILDESGTTLTWIDVVDCIQEEYSSHFPDNKKEINVENFQKLQDFHNHLLNNIDVNGHYEERLDKVLVVANVDGMVGLQTMRRL